MSYMTYRNQLIRPVRGMAMANRQADASGAIAGKSAPAPVEMFLDGNSRKRFDSLSGRLAFLATAFDCFDSLVDEYMQAQPLAAHQTGSHDGKRMLVWLTQFKTLTPRQQDYVACQHARQIIEDSARKNRLKHLRFQQIFSLANQFAAQLERDEQLRIYLNPIRTWTRFITGELLDAAAGPPANVLFFATRGGVATAFLELEGQALMNELADYQPCTLCEWAAISNLADRAQLVEVCRDLLAMGLVALEQDAADARLQPKGPSAA